jgi:hypothetical protein
MISIWKAGPDCDMTDKSGSGQNAAHMAAMMGHVNVLHFLLHEVKPPVEPNTPDHRGWTPLHFAASQAREGVANYLVGISKVRPPPLVDAIGQSSARTISVVLCRVNVEQ